MTSSPTTSLRYLSDLFFVMHINRRAQQKKGAMRHPNDGIFFAIFFLGQSFRKIFLNDWKMIDLVGLILRQEHFYPCHVLSRPRNRLSRSLTNSPRHTSSIYKTATTADNQKQVETICLSNKTSVIMAHLPAA